MSHNDLHATAEQNVHREARACQGLMSAVITSAISDACRPPIKEAVKVHGEKVKKKGNNEKYKEHTPTGHARTGMYFLFAESGGLEYYAQWLDIDAGTFRKALLSQMHEEKQWEAFNKRITDQQKRNFRFNYQWHLRKHGDKDINNEAMYLCDDSDSSD